VSKQFVALFENDNEWEVFLDLYNHTAYEILTDFLANPKGHLSLRRIPKAALVKVWGEYAKYGRDPDPELVDKLCMMMVKGIAVLSVCTRLQGHTDDGSDHYSVFKDTFSWEREETYQRVNEDDLYAYLVVDIGFHNRSDTISMWSDFGVRPLQALVPGLLSDHFTPVQRMRVLDQALNVVHQRSDLAAFFVEGGSQTLRYVCDFVQSTVLIDKPKQEPEYPF
jgi:hypothetical protein